MRTRLFPGACFLVLLFAPLAKAFAAAAFQVSYGVDINKSTAVADGGKITLGTANTTGNFVVFWIRNTGTTNLTGVSVSPVSGTDYSLSAVTSNNPFSPGTAAGFTASLLGVNTSHKQVIHITADGLTANPYDIELDAPEISVESPVGTVLTSNQFVDFGKLGAASPGTLTFTVRNVGSATLSNIQLGYYTNIGTQPYQYADYTSSGLDAHFKSLAPSGALTFTLSLKPGAKSNHDSKWYVPSNDADEVPFKIHLRAPEITVEQPAGTALTNGTAEVDFGNLGGATPNMATITIRNTGTADLNGVNAVITGAGAGEYTLVSLPATTVAPDTSTTFNVAFDPTLSQGPHLATLDVQSTDADEGHFHIALKAPEIALETSGRDLVNNSDYGFDTDFGTSRTTVFTIRNKGTAALRNIAVSLGGTAAADYTVFGPAVTTLAPNATTTFNVKFSPAAPGPRVAFMQIASNDGNENPFKITFREPRIQVEQAGAALVPGKSTLDFGALPGGPSNTITLTVRNVGGADLTDLSTVLSGVDSADYTIGPLGATTLASNASTTFTITLDPASPKTHAATLDILSNDDARSPFRLFLKAPEIAVERPAGTNLVDGVSLADFGTVSTANTSTFTFTVRNRGSSPLKNLVPAINGANASDFIVAAPALTTLVPGASTTFTVKFSPLLTGPRSAALHLANNDVDENPFDILLTGFGMAILQHPSPQLVGVGESASFTVSAVTAGPPVFTWLKNGLPVPGTAAHAATYTIPVVALSDAGSYSCLVVDGLVTVSSGKARLGVVGSAITPQTFNEGSTIALKVSESIPPGTPPTHQWKKNNAPFGNAGSPPGQVVSGATTASLSITKAGAVNPGSYTCVVGMDGLGKESGAFNVAVRLKPVINAAGPFGWLVSGTVADAITAANAPTSFSFTGLPAGVAGNSKTGQLSGKPNAATTGPKSFSVSAANAAGTGPPATIGYSVAALPATVVGTFNGLIDRSTALSGPVAGQLAKGHGGSLSNLVITSTGSFTGTVALEDKSHPLPAGGRLNAVAGGNPTASVAILRGTASDAVPDLTLVFAIDKDTGELTGTLSDGIIATPVAVKARHNPWMVSTNASLNHPATAFAGSYTAALLLDAALAGTDPNTANLAYPQGTGFLTFTITPAGGVSGGGTLADGTVITASTTLGPEGEIPLHVMLYTPAAAVTAGSLHGWTKVTGTDWDSVPPFDWRKHAQASASPTRSYKAGFPLHNLTLAGGLYVKPSSIVFGLSDPPSNAKLAFSEGGIKDSTLGAGGSLGQVFSLSTSNVVTMPAGAANNPGMVTLSTFNLSTGAIGGSFTLTDDDPRTTVAATATVTRTTPWSGVLVPRLNRGVGQFQLARLPTSDPPATTPATSPTLSGKLELLSNK